MAALDFRDFGDEFVLHYGSSESRVIDGRALTQSLGHLINALQVINWLIPAIRNVANAIARRVLFLAASIALLASGHSAHSSSPPFYFIDPKLLVVDYRLEVSSPDLLPSLSKEEILPQLVSYIESELSRRGVSIPIVLRGGSSKTPSDVVEDAILYVTIRIDLSKTSRGENGDALVVGTVSLTLLRLNTSTSSLIPYELFAVPFQDYLVRSTVITAAKQHLDKALIEPIAKFYRR